MTTCIRAVVFDTSVPLTGIFAVWISYSAIRMWLQGLRLRKIIISRECSNVDEYAEIQSKLLPKIERLANLPGGNTLAFDCMALMSENLWGDMERKDASGYGDTEEPYLRMDQTMLKYAEQSFADGEWAPEVISEILGKLNKNRTILAIYGVKRYFPRTVSFLRDSSVIPAIGSGLYSAGSELDT